MSTAVRQNTALSVRARLSRRNNDGAAFELDVQLDLPPGITILFGPSGTGKSTLLDCISGLVQSDSGKIVFAGETVFDTQQRIDIPTQLRRVGYLFQSPALFPHLSVEQNILYGIHDLASEEQQLRLEKILAEFRIDSLRHRKPREISGGEAQRVALARALVTQPRVLLLDEPLTGLDAELKSALVTDLRAWNAEHRIPILYVTHDRGEVDALGERAVILEHGKIVGQGIPRQVLDAPRRPSLAQAAGFENLLDGTVTEIRADDGVMRVRIGNSTNEIEVPLGQANPGEKIKVAIRAGDILLASEKPFGLSARNILRGTVQSVEQRGSTVHCLVTAGVLFEVHITLGAQRALNLQMGGPIWLVLKTYSCHVVV